MEHILNIVENKEKLNDFFRKIKEGNAILFLGAGASIGEKKYLSNEIIEYYEDYLGREFQENDITQFVDILSADPTFKRSHFDITVADMLRKLKPTPEHRTIVSLPWRQIITTNFDLLIERAYDEVRITTNDNYEIVPVRNKQEYNYNPSNIEIKYVKLNGCISDKGKYPLAFSTRDFQELKSYYKIVLNDLRNLSNNILFLTVGYSFRDKFSKKLIMNFDSYKFREQKWIINIDPYPNESSLHYYSQQRICVIKCSFQDFFTSYANWETEEASKIVTRKKISITNSKNQYINFTPQLMLKLDGKIIQFNNNYKSKFINPIDFYKGEEPNFNVVQRQLDVARESRIGEFVEHIFSVIGKSKTTLIPIFFLKGEFGIGKTTFALRLIYEMINNSEYDVVAFEIIDFVDLVKSSIVEVLSKSIAKNILFYCDQVEIDSIFKDLLELRRELSIEQFNDINIFFLVPIRENILEKYKYSRDMKEVFDLCLDASLSEKEIYDLLDKLNSVGIIRIRDTRERASYKKIIEEKYSRDSFVSFLSIVDDGQHKNDLLKAYNELSNIAKKAFLFTALMHRFKLDMPATILKRILGIEWDDFIDRIVRTEGKGLFIQKEVASYGTNPDLYFHTKHSIVAEELIKLILPKKDEQYNYYRKILNSVEYGRRNSFMVTNLLKILVREGIFNTIKISQLYDSGYQKLSEDPFFLFHYSSHLRKRGGIENLKRALKLVVYAESLLNFKNSKFIHRKAMINFELAREYAKNETEYNYTLTYMQEAKEDFQIKLIYDPFSAFSYTDYIRLLIWELTHVKRNEREQLSIRIKIEELLQLAKTSVNENSDWISEVEYEYTCKYTYAYNDQDYKNKLMDLYGDFKLRPYACILLYNYYKANLDSDCKEKCSSLIDEMTQYTDNNEVIKFLFRYYGESLFNTDNRGELFLFCAKYEFLQLEFPMKYYYYKFIAESYSYNFNNGKNELSKLKSSQYNINPEYKQIWRDKDGIPLQFNGYILFSRNGSYKRIRILELQQTFPLIKGNYEEFKVNQNVKVFLHFYIRGIFAEIISDESH